MNVNRLRFRANGVMEYWSGGVVEWWSTGVVEYWSGGVLRQFGIAPRGRGVGVLSLFTFHQSSLCGPGRRS
jgi:hypothetical protein